METESHVANQSSDQADQAVKNFHLPSKRFSSCFFESESSIFIKTVNSDIRRDRTPIFRLYCIGGSKVEVEVPKMQKQSYSSNNCPAFVAAYMVDLCDQSTLC